MPKKRGAKPNYVPHPETGEDIVGLYANCDKNGRVRYYYYLDENGKQKTCTSNIRKAIQRYNAFCESNKYPELIEIPEEAREVEIPGTMGRGALILDGYISQTWIIEEFQKILEENRKLVVDVTGNPNYWDFENTPSRPRSLTCSEVLEEYLNIKRKKSLNIDYRYKMIRHWNVFKKIVNKVYIRDITFKDVKRYRKQIIAEAEQKKEEGTIKRPDLYINERFSAVHDILNKIYALQEYKRDIDILLGHIGQLVRIPKDKIRVKAITPEQWKILYDHSADTLFIRCSLLLGLNCAMTWGDIIDLCPENFNFEIGSYIGTRSKNGIQNCAILFPETVKYLKEYIKINPPADNGTIFFNRNVTRKTFIDDIIKDFKEWKKSLPKTKFKKVENITHSFMRKATKTSAMKAKCNTEYIKLVMGRKLEGSEEHYTEKDAIMTTKVIDAVYSQYFK